PHRVRRQEVGRARQQSECRGRVDEGEQRMRRRHIRECYVASRAQRQSRREDQPFDELAPRDLLVGMKRLIRKQVDDIAADQKLDAVFCPVAANRSEEHTSELQSRFDLVCRLLLEKKKKKIND